MIDIIIGDVFVVVARLRATAVVTLRCRTLSLMERCPQTDACRPGNAGDGAADDVAVGEGGAIWMERMHLDSTAEESRECLRWSSQQRRQEAVRETMCRLGLQFVKA